MMLSRLLSGFIAPEVGNLALLIKLDLGHNKLFGESEKPQEGKAFSALDLTPRCAKMDSCSDSGLSRLNSSLVFITCRVTQ